MRVQVVAVWLLAVTPMLAQAQGAWRQYATPEEAGFATERLRAAHTYADSVGSAAVMAVYRGHVLVAWGDVSRRIPAHSVRKSLVSALYGIALERKELRLDATLGQLGIDDHAGLTVAEKGATIAHLLAARSGVYLPAAYAGADQDASRPARGSHAPGTHWFYNNWDFNVAGVLHERATKSNLYESFAERIARPIGMEDYRPADGFRVYEPGLSRHPAHTFDISARDLARFGLLYLQSGRWQGQQVVPAAWVRESTRAHSDLGNGTGYGYMWWTYARGALSQDYPHLARHDIYMGRGTGGQAVFVIPDAELVIVHRGDTGNNRPVAGVHAWQIAERILAARAGEPRTQPASVALTPIPFRSQLPAAATPTFVALDSAAMSRLVGSYDIAPGVALRVFVFEGRLFMYVPERGEAELFALGPHEFTIRVQAGVHIRFDTDATGAVTGVTLRMGPETVRARRATAGGVQKKDGGIHTLLRQSSARAQPGRMYVLRGARACGTRIV